MAHMELKRALNSSTSAMRGLLPIKSSGGPLCRHFPLLARSLSLWTSDRRTRPHDGLLRRRCGRHQLPFQLLRHASTTTLLPSSSSPELSRLTRKRASEATGPLPFEKVLIANRGEIVQRVIRTCRDLGIETVAVHSTADSKAPFVRMADEAVYLGPPAAAESYLHVERILQAAQQTGAQAIHPGYGFLSENADFSQAVQQAGLVFLGPSANAIHQLGDKLESKHLAKAVGVSIVPGYDGEVQSIEQALHIAHDVIGGYPVLLKAAAGGGGKGMRICYNDQDVKEAWHLAKSEALKFFKDDRLLLEKYIERPHHIEFQVMAATRAGTGSTDVVVFPERECSIQRRNQKVVEESPSVLLQDDTRRAMAQQVRQLCQAVQYESAGTVEFLVDEQQRFYFLEMNTRLQVEHPVTEAITGVDLVKAMLWVGAGWGLPEELAPYIRPQDVYPHRGHAVEARVYAEDPLRGFLPSTGPLTQYMEPRATEAPSADRYIRVDSGVVHGHVVTPHYDPMLSKLISYAPNRIEAIDGLNQALDEYVIEGVQHNARLVQSVLRHEAFRAGHTPTSFLPTHYPQGFAGVELTDVETQDFAVAAALISTQRQALLNQPPLAGSPLKQEDGSLHMVVKLGGMFGKPFMVTISRGGGTCAVESLSPEANSSPTVRTVRVDAPIQYDPLSFLAHVSLDGTSRTVQVLNESATGELKMQMHGADTLVLIQTAREFELSQYMREPIAPDTTNVVQSPMPGTLISYAVHQGDQVQPGQELCIVEAMKMQNIIRSPRAGTIAKCRVAVGSSLKADEVLVEFSP